MFMLYLLFAITRLHRNIFPYIIRSLSLLSETTYLEALISCPYFFYLDLTLRLSLALYRRKRICVFGCAMFFHYIGSSSSRGNGIKKKFVRSLSYAMPKSVRESKSTLIGHCHLFKQVTNNLKHDSP